MSEYFKKYASYRSNKEQLTPPLLLPENLSEEESKILKNRFEIIYLINDLCEKRGVSISLNTNSYLKSYSNKPSVNFWHYESQGDYDKAPTK